MLKLRYEDKQKKQANTFLALGLSEYEAASVLIEKGIFRESVFHLYFCSLYITQSLLAHKLPKKAGHKSVEREFHKRYGKHSKFPRRYVELHSMLHRLRNEYNYNVTITPVKKDVLSLSRRLEQYLNYCKRAVPKITYHDLISDLLSSNTNIKDLSFDYYCPKTYSHHTRFTVWLRPSYNQILTPKKIAAGLSRLTRDLRVRKRSNYVLGFNSKVNQYSDEHLVLLDFDSFDQDVESELLKIKGILLKTGRGFHFISNRVVAGNKKWEKLMKSFLRNRRFRNKIDRPHVEISLKRGYATLRITPSPIKTTEPFFFKELWKA